MSKIIMKKTVSSMFGEKQRQKKINRSLIRIKSGNEYVMVLVVVVHQIHLFCPMGKNENKT